MKTFIVIKSEEEMRRMNDELGAKAVYLRITTQIGDLEGIRSQTASWRQAVLYVSAEDVQALLNSMPAPSADKPVEEASAPLELKDLITEEDLPEEYRKMPADSDLLLAASPFFETESEKKAKAKAAEEAATQDPEAQT